MFWWRRAKQGPASPHETPGRHDRGQTSIGWPAAALLLPLQRPTVSSMTVKALTTLCQLDDAAATWEDGAAHTARDFICFSMLVYNLVLKRCIVSTGWQPEAFSLPCSLPVVSPCMSSAVALVRVSGWPSHDSQRLSVVEPASCYSGCSNQLCTLCAVCLLPLLQLSSRVQVSFLWLSITVESWIGMWGD
jgi:hypothetical protein